MAHDGEGTGSHAAHKAGGGALGENYTVKESGRLRNRHITMITLGGIIGASLFVGSGNIVRSVGPVAILVYLFGGLLVFLAMRMLGEMAARKPSVGSFMEYADQSLGGWAAYLVGWLYWYYWAGIIAYEASVGGDLLNGWFPALPTWLWSFLMVLLFVVSNMFSVRMFGEIEFWLASVKVVTIVVFLVIGALFMLGLWPGSHFSIPNLWTHGGFAPNGMSPVVMAIATVVFSYFGTEIAVMAAAESVDPAKGINKATRTVIWRILLFFVGGVFIIVTAVPWDELPKPSDVAPFAYIYGLFGLPGARLIMEIVLFTAVVSVLNSGLYSAPRMMAALSDKGYAPRLFTRRSRHGTPIAALFASCLGALAAVVAKFAVPSDAVFNFIMNSAGLVALFIYTFIALAQWRMRMKLTPEERASLRVRSWFTPVLNIVVIAVVIAVVIIMMFDPESSAQVWTSLIAAGALVVAWPFVSRTLKRRGISVEAKMDVERRQRADQPDAESLS